MATELQNQVAEAWKDSRNREELLEVLSVPDNPTMIAEMTCSRGHHWFVRAAWYDPETGDATFGSSVDYCLDCEGDASNADMCWIGDPDDDPFASSVFWGRVYVAKEVEDQGEPPEWLQAKWAEAEEARRNDEALRSLRRKLEGNPNKALVAWVKAGGEGNPVVYSRSWSWSSNRKRKAKTA